MPLEVPTEQDAILLKTLGERMRQVFTNTALPPEIQQRGIMALEKEMNDHTKTNPNHPALLFMLGSFYVQLEKAGVAIALLEKAIKEGIDGHEPLLNLARAYKSEHDDEMAEHYYMQAAAAARKANDLKALAHAYHGVGSL